MDEVMTARPRQGAWSNIRNMPADPLLSLIGQFNQDARVQKIDLGVGVYKDDHGVAPVFQAIKRAEQQLLDTQQTKAYLGSEGDIGFVACLTPLIFGPALRDEIIGLQTPGGTGALRLGADCLKAANPAGARIHLGLPAWANHRPIFEAAGLNIVEHTYFDVKAHRLCFEKVLQALEQAAPGDAILLQASGHNPTGCDFTPDQWQRLATEISGRGIVPFIDMAYHGLCGGLDRDAYGARLIIDACPDVLLAYSCDKNFGLYRDRVGALFATTRRGEQGAALASMLSGLARANWSMPPDHGAALVRLILTDPGLTEMWQSELETMGQRIASVRQALGAAHPLFQSVPTETGMFSMLALSHQEITTLRERFGIYMPNSGRISVSGLNSANLPHFLDAIFAIRGDGAQA